MDEKPGIDPDPKSLAEKMGMWLGLGLLTWAILLGIVIVTVKVLQSLF